MVLKTVSARVVGLPVAPMYGVHVRLDDRAERQAALAVVDAEGDRDALDGDDLADQARKVGDGTAQLSGEQPEQGALLLVGRPVVDEHGRLPRLRDQDVLGDVGRHGDRQAAHVDAFDGSLLDAPGDRGVAGRVVRVLAHPARAQDVAGADLEQPALDVVGHGSSPQALAPFSRSIDRHRSYDRHPTPACQAPGRERGPPLLGSAPSSPARPCHRRVPAEPTRDHLP